MAVHLSGHALIRTMLKKLGQGHLVLSARCEASPVPTKSLELLGRGEVTKKIQKAVEFISAEFR